MTSSPLQTARPKTRLVCGKLLSSGQVIEVPAAAVSSTDHTLAKRKLIRILSLPSGKVQVRSLW